MKRFTLAAFVAVLLPMAACNNPNPQPNPTPPPNNPAVEVQGPGTTVQSDKNGTEVKTPGADVEVNKK
ncbi:MAG TPA: hypothetical protein VMJ32_04700 [Pirellulales bacterium]|nr:hypothetical protein [Pirellulales bacterium]